MGILDGLGSILEQASSGKASEAEVHSAYDQVTSAVHPDDLASGIAHAFKSDQTPAFEQMVSGLFNGSNGEQKAGLLNQLLGTLGSSGVMQALAGAGGMAGLAGLLSGGNVTPQQAQQVPPEAVQVLAQQAARKEPSIMDRAASFYAQHPALVKSIGAGALAVLMSRLSAGRR